jgi:protein SCO1/2
MGPLGLIYGPGKDEIIHNLCTAIIGPEGKLVRLEVGTQSNKWSSGDLLKTIYSQVPSQQK